MANGPAAVIHDDGSVMLYYKSTQNDQTHWMAYGVAQADTPTGPYRRMLDKPIFGNKDEVCYEDAYVWYGDGRYHMIFNDLRGTFTGEQRGGGYATSDDGLHWQPAGKAYSRTITWTDGSTTTQGCIERPSLLRDSTGKPTHLFAATADGTLGFTEASHTWNIAIPRR